MNFFVSFFRTISNPEDTHSWAARLVCCLPPRKYEEKEQRRATLRMCSTAAVVVVGDFILSRGTIWERVGLRRRDWQELMSLSLPPVASYFSRSRSGSPIRHNQVKISNRIAVRQGYLPIFACSSCTKKSHLAFAIRPPVLHHVHRAIPDNHHHVEGARFHARHRRQLVGD